MREVMFKRSIHFRARYFRKRHGLTVILRAIAAKQAEGSVTVEAKLV